MLYLPGEIINYILVLCDGITRERCSVVCKLFSNILDTFKNINKEYIKNRDPVLYKEVRLLKFDDDELYEVCGIGDIELLKYYSTKDLDFNFGLCGACRYGNMNNVKFLIQKGINNFNGGLYRACGGGHINIVKFLVQKGATSFSLGLRGACNGGHIEIVELMIKLGAKDFKYALYGARRGKHIEIIKILLPLIENF